MLRYTGSSVEDRGDHLVVRTPANPQFHWGNFVLITDAGQLDDPSHWIDVFTAVHPGADWVSLGLPRLPEDTTPWADLDLSLEQEDVLSTTVLPGLLPAPGGYQVRALASDDDWEQYIARQLRENAETGEYEPVHHEQFVRAQAVSRRQMSHCGVACWFGAFTGGALVADLGIVLCGDWPPTARYQSVGTDAAHRRRGLAGHLLGIAARWAADHGALRWVIVTEVTNPAGRLYRAVGFRPDIGHAQAYRRSAGRSRRVTRHGAVRWAAGS